MNKFSLLLLSIAFISIFSSCSKKQPSCDGTSLKKAQELFEKGVVTEVAFRNYLDEKKLNGWFSNAMEMTGKSLEQLVKDIHHDFENEVNGISPASESRGPFIQKAQEYLNASHNKMVDPRTSSKDEDLRKCSCEADFSNDTSKPTKIAYTVQITDEDKEIVTLDLED